MANEEYFPRGDPLKRSSEVGPDVPKAKRAKTEDAAEDLFGTAAGVDRKVRKKLPKVLHKSKGAKQPNRKKQQRASGTVQDGATSIETLTTKRISDGLMLLGCVKKVNDYGIVMGLPNNLTGYVSIADISDGYKALLHRYAMGGADTEAASQGSVASPVMEPHPLEDMFSLGTVLPCKVISTPTAQGGRVKLTLNPRDVNQYLTVTSLKSGTVLYGAISSEEDHGYTVDLGISGVTAFLARNKLNKAAYLVGEIVRVAVKSSDLLGLVSGENRVVTVTAKARSIAKAEKKLLSSLGSSATAVFRDFIPGMCVSAEVEHVTDEGLYVKFATVKGCVHRGHFMGTLDSQLKGSQLRCRLLYIDPTSKLTVLTSLPHLVDGLGEVVAFPVGITRGLVLDGTVTRVYKNKAVLLQLCRTDEHGNEDDFDGKLYGYASKQHLMDGVLPDGCQTFKRGTEHKCRILEFDLLEKKVMVSLRKSILDQEFLDYANLCPGQPIKAVLRAFHKQGVSVKIGRTLRGFVPFLHLTDVPLKKPQMKFKKGDELKCKILTVDAERKRVILTAKKSLLSKSCVPLASYSTAQRGQVYQGVIVKVMPNGCLVAFFNNVKGWVPKAHLSTEQIPYPDKVFYIGQVVKCQVVTCIAAEERLVLSFKLENLKPFGKKEVALPPGFEIGGVVSCHVVGRTASGLDVTIGPEAVPAYLPVHHLSDTMPMANQLLPTYNRKDEITVVYFNKTGALTVSAKPCFVNAGLKKVLPKTLDDLKPGRLYPGVVKRILDYGAFIDLGGGLTGLCPNKYLSNRRVSHASDLLQVGQSVYSKVTEVDASKHRFLVSLRMSDCYHGDALVGLTLLTQHLQEEERIRRHYVGAANAGDAAKSKVASYSIGAIIKVVVSEVSDLGLLLSVQGSTVRALATNENASGSKAVAGDQILAVVTYVDVEHGCLECSVQPDVVKRVKSYCENKFSQAKPGQVIKGETLVVKDGWLLAILRAHAAGRLVYVPSKRHLNDWDGKAASHPGQVNPLLVRETFGSLSLCTIQTDEEKKKVSLSKSSVDLPVAGSVVKAEVKSIVEMQMNVSVKLDNDSYQLPGRIHVTEVVDADSATAEALQAPLAGYAIGDIVSAVITGYREVKVKSALPITRPHDGKALAELSLRPSRQPAAVSSGGGSQPSSVEQESPPTVGQHNKGDRVAAFVDKVTNDAIHVKVTPTVSGIVPWWGVSHDNAFIQRFTVAGASMFPVGSGHLATVLDTHKDGSLLLSLTGVDCIVRKGASAKAMVSGASCQGVYVTLPHGFRGKVPVSELSDGLEHAPWEQYVAGAVLDCAVLACERKLACVLSLRRSRQSKKGKNDHQCIWTDPLHTTVGTFNASTVKAKSLVRGYVTTASSKGVFLAICDDLVGRADLSHASSYFVVDPESAFFKGMCVIAKVLSVSSSENHIDVSLLEEDTGRPEPADPIYLGEHRLQKSADGPAAEQSGKKQESRRRREQSESSDNGQQAPTSAAALQLEPITPNASGSSPARKRRKPATAKPTAFESVSVLPAVGFDLDTTLGTLLAPLGGSQLELPAGAAAGPAGSGLGAVPRTTAAAAAGLRRAVLPSNQGTEAGSKTKTAKALSEAETEAMLYETEQRLASSDRALETADDYERLVRQSPDSSMAWLGYMSHCLDGSSSSSAASSGANVEAARAVAERALAAVSYREEQERLNVWSAYLNLESQYGSADTLQAVLSRATQNMDPLKVYQRLIAIYVASAKMEAAEGIHLMLSKKFSQNKDVWINCALFYFRNGKAESGRELMHRCLKSLPKAVHGDVLARFAQMEFKHGSPERGRTLFETLLSTYPRRTDLWSVYVDMMLKHTADAAQARLLLDRAVSQSFPLKTLKFFYKKYVELEEAHGDAASVDAVRQRALACCGSATDSAAALGPSGGVSL